MALEKDIEVKELGVVAKYWKIAKVCVDMFTDTIEVTLYGWMSQEDREAMKKPVKIKRIILGDEDYKKIMQESNIIKAVYDNIKSREIKIEDIVVIDFTGSRDI